MAAVVRQLINYSTVNDFPHIENGCVFSMKDGSLMCTDKLSLGHTQVSGCWRLSLEADCRVLGSGGKGARREPWPPAWGGANAARLGRR